MSYGDGSYLYGEDEYGSGQYGYDPYRNFQGNAVVGVAVSAPQLNRVRNFGGLATAVFSAHAQLTRVGTQNFSGSASLAFSVSAPLRIVASVSAESNIAFSSGAVLFGGPLWTPGEETPDDWSEVTMDADAWSLVVVPNKEWEDA